LTEDDLVHGWKDAGETALALGKLAEIRRRHHRSRKR
jgi:hypothetical protein